MTLCLQSLLEMQIVEVQVSAVIDGGMLPTCLSANREVSNFTGKADTFFKENAFAIHTESRHTPCNRLTC